MDARSNQTQGSSGHLLILSSRVVGTTVYSRGGDRIGHLDNNDRQGE
jgi:hypothetical protein